MTFLCCYDVDSMSSSSKGPAKWARRISLRQHYYEQKVRSPRHFFPGDMNKTTQTNVNYASWKLTLVAHLDYYAGSHFRCCATHDMRLLAWPMQIVNAEFALANQVERGETLRHLQISRTVYRKQWEKNVCCSDRGFRKKLKIDDEEKREME